MNQFFNRNIKNMTPLNLRRYHIYDIQENWEVSSLFYVTRTLCVARIRMCSKCQFLAAQSMRKDIAYVNTGREMNTHYHTTLCAEWSYKYVNYFRVGNEVRPVLVLIRHFLRESPF